MQLFVHLLSFLRFSQFSRCDYVSAAGIYCIGGRAVSFYRYYHSVVPGGPSNIAVYVRDLYKWRGQAGRYYFVLLLQQLF